MFQVKATVIGFKGDEEKYPCHFQHKVGDQFLWDGEKFIGRICPYVAGPAVTRMMEMARLGPRAVSPLWYMPFWYAPVSRKEPGNKKYDGLGFRNVLETVPEAPYHVASLQPAGAFTWPPPAERTVGKENIVMCGDSRTSLMLKLEAFDLSDKGDATPYFRRQMSILNKVSAKAGIRVDRILGEFSKDEIEIPYPALGEVLVEALAEELALIGYLAIAEGKATVTKSGQAKLDAFKKGLPPEEQAALNMGPVSSFGYARSDRTREASGARSTGRKAQGHKLSSRRPSHEGEREMGRRFASKVALVTGGTSGLGRDAAVAFAREGAQVVVTGRRIREGQETVALAKAAGGEATFVPADLSNPGEIEALFSACGKTYGGLDCAFNNAGIDGTINTHIADYKLEVWNQVMAVNLTAMFLCMKYEITAMLKRGGGAIVNMGAVASLKAGPVVGAAYIASKHAIVGLTQTGAIEYAGQGIRANVICPAVMRTPLSDKLMSTEEGRARVLSMHPMGRIGEPEEVSNLVLWLCSQEAGFITGAVIPIDGGFLLK